MIQKWEYLRLIPGYNSIEEMNAFGLVGWELVGFYDDYAYFKRPLQPKNALGDEEELAKVEDVKLDEGYWSK